MNGKAADCDVHQREKYDIICLIMSPNESRG